MLTFGVLLFSLLMFKLALLLLLPSVLAMLELLLPLLGICRPFSMLDYDIDCTTGVQEVSVAADLGNVAVFGPHVFEESSSFIAFVQKLLALARTGIKFD